MKMKETMKRIYPLLVILIVAVCFVFIRRPLFKTTTPAPIEQSENLVPLNYKFFEEALCDSCELSHNKLTCSPNIIKKICSGVKAASLDSVSNNFIIFHKGETNDCIYVPAAVIANMSDMGLFQTSKKQSNGK